MRQGSRRIAVGAAVAVALVVALATGNARAGSGLLTGFADNVLLSNPSTAVPAAHDLGASAFRVSVNWAPGQTTLTSADAAALDRAFASAAGLRIVLVVTGGAASYAPQDDPSRDTFCTYARSILARYPALQDVVIWNEPNKTASWLPQFNPDDTSAAPSAYEALLARCYDVLHAFRQEVNVLGFALSPDGNDNPHAVSNISHSPGNFIRKLGEAYRASARLAPVLDSVAHHVYGATSAERPWKQHTGQTRIAEGDWDKLMTNLHTAFDGTAQGVPGQCVSYRCVSIWYLEDGFQTSIDAAKLGLYTNTENVTVIPDDAGGEPASPPPSADSPAPDQATQIVDAVRLAYCQNYVAAFLNFLLVDDGDLRGWQSGPLWVDATPKDSYDEFQRAFGEANSRSVDCTQLKGGLPPRPDTTAPAAPAGLAASTTPGEARVSLDWTDNAETDVRGYDVYRGTASGGPYQKLNVDTVPASAYADLTVSFSQTYYYVVAAVDTADNVSAASSEVSARPLGPTAVRLRSFTGRRIVRTVVIRWRTATDSATLGFNVYRDGRRRNRALIASSGKPGGTWYAFRDRLPRGSTRAEYRLETVLIDGTRIAHRPLRIH